MATVISPVKAGFKTLLIYIFVTIILFPLLLVISIPLFISRQITILASKCKSGLQSPLSLTSCNFVVDKLYKDPYCTLLLSLYMDGSMDKRALDKRIFTILENKYPELKQYLYRWMGVYFWKEDPNFSLDNHISFNQEGFKTLEELNQERARLVKKPFVQLKPLWELVIYENCTISPDYSTVINLRIHHCLADGYSILKFLTSFSDSNNPMNSVAKPNYIKRSICSKIWFYLRLVFFGPIHTLATALEIKDQNTWKVSKDKLQGDYHNSETNQVSLDRVREIAQTHGVRTSAVIFAALTGAIRNYMLETNTSIPDQIKVICPFPLPSHPNYMTNHMTFVPLKAPISEPDPMKRLKIIQASFESAQNSVLPYGFSGLAQIGGLFASFLQKGPEKNLCTIIMTNFPAPKERQIMFGNTIKEVKLSAGLQKKGLVIGFCSLSYGGNLLLGIKADRAVFPESQSTKTMLDYIVKEFDILSDNFV